MLVTMFMFNTHVAYESIKYEGYVVPSLPYSGLWPTSIYTDTL